MNITPRSVGPDFIAVCLGVQRRHISKLAADGIVIRLTRGKYDLPASIKNYFAKKETTFADARQKNVELDNEAREFDLAIKYEQVHSVAEYSMALEQTMAGVAKILEAMRDDAIRQDSTLPESALEVIDKTAINCQNKIAVLLENEGKEPEEHS